MTMAVTETVNEIPLQQRSYYKNSSSNSVRKEQIWSFFDKLFLNIPIGIKNIDDNFQNSKNFPTKYLISCYYIYANFKENFNNTINFNHW